MAFRPAADNFRFLGWVASACCCLCAAHLALCAAAIRARPALLMVPAFLGTHLSRCGYRSCGGRGLRPAWTTLAELRFDSGYLHGNRFKLASIADEGHLEDGVV
jgi:hypothetical protein